MKTRGQLVRSATRAIVDQGWREEDGQLVRGLRSWRADHVVIPGRYWPLVIDAVAFGQPINVSLANVTGQAYVIRVIQLDIAGTLSCDLVSSGRCRVRQ